MHEPTGVIVVEDEAATRESLINAISGTDNMVVLAAVGTLEEAREAVETVPPRALIVDLKLPDGSGIDLIRYVHRHRPNVDVMVVSILGDAPTVLEAIEAGATSYILKDATGPDIVTALREMLAGRSPISAAVARHIVRQLQQTPSPNQREATTQSLTERELQVLESIARGLTYRDIADRLGLSANTIPTHIKSICRKLEVRSGAAAVFEAGRRGLIDLSSAPGRDDRQRK